MKNKKNGHIGIIFVTTAFVLITIVLVIIFFINQGIKTKNTHKSLVSNDTVSTEVEVLKVIDDEDTYVTIVKHMDHEHVIDSKEIYEYSKDKIGEKVKGYANYSDVENNHTIDLVLK